MAYARCRQSIPRPNSTTIAHEFRLNGRRRQIATGKAVVLGGLLALAYAPAALATASAEEAAQLKTTLTPMGAERQGNANGTIPSWSGGYKTAPPDYRQGAPRQDPFAKEKPLFSITASNFESYGDKIPEGAKILFRRNSDYRMDVYPTHRTAAFPQSVYDNIFRNATRAHAASAGIAYGVEGAAGGIPFPIPKNGAEIIWNHLLAFWGPGRELHVNTYVVSPDGNIRLSSGYNEVADFPYYYPGATPMSYGGYYFKTRHIDDTPPAKVGEGYLAWQPIDTARYKFAAWRVLPGERRVRRGPSLSYDIPDPDASGFENLDEYYIFFGGPDRYDFKLVGKQEMYIPYNNNRFYLRPAREILGPKHANPDDLRYELHRVWVVEGTLAPGKHHIAPRRKLFVDEDTWLAMYSESWDEDGKLWKFAHGTMYLMPEIPAAILGSQFVYDFDLGGYVFGFSFNGQDRAYRVTPPHGASAFAPEALAAQAVR
ncbi:MAG TPA: DUF1329 domain-containing protein [Rhizomicrobium sp.]|nr:DUF1329 domain-containing protein [Rhizomicrobium sp.]